MKNLPFSDEPREAAEPVKRVDDSAVAEGFRLLLEYKRGKSVLEQRIISNEEWYRLRHNRV